MIPLAQLRKCTAELWGKKTELLRESLEIRACIKVEEKTTRDSLDPTKRTELAETQRYAKGGLPGVCTPFND